MWMTDFVLQCSWLQGSTSSSVRRLCVVVVWWWLSASGRWGSWSSMCNSVQPFWR